MKEYQAPKIERIDFDISVTMNLTIYTYATGVKYHIISTALKQQIIKNSA